MVQQNTTNLHQEMFENAVAALLVAMAQLPSRIKEARSKTSRRTVRGSSRRAENVKRTNHH